MRGQLLRVTIISAKGQSPGYLSLIPMFDLIPVQLRQEKVQLEQTLEQEQEQQISKLMKKIHRLEKETLLKQTTLEQVQVKWQQ